MIAAGLASVLLPYTSAQAEDAGACLPGLVCASQPETLMEGLERAELEPELVTDDDGDPMIKAHSENWEFFVYFYGCVEHKKCDSVQFSIGWRDDGTHTPELANRWNSTKRFLQMSVTDEKDLMVRYDVGTIGGMRKENFADVVDWWVVMLDHLSDFFKKVEEEAQGVTIPGSNDGSAEDPEAKSSPLGAAA